ncbi:MAG TPA: acyltransferase [Jatrophihabitantaceae bacterium]|nr:acyltransferase [Jatrophihabitantaceae bacterium]
MRGEAAPEAATRPVTSIDGRAPGTGVRRLPFVDGIRGFAAVVVLLNHAIFFPPTMHEPALLTHASLADLLVWPFHFGAEMVELFLLISGFSLYYSELARRAKGRPPTTLRQFAARRAWRIGPVYYLAIVAGLAVVLPLGDRLNVRPADATVVQATIGGFVSHVFFVHSFHGTWLYQINAPLWSIALEVQLYLLFPLLYFAMRRWNPWLVAIVTLILVRIVNLTPLDVPIFRLARWFVAGALLAELVHRGVRVRARYALPAGLAALLLGMAHLTKLQPGARHDAIWLAAFVLLIFAALEYPDAQRNPMSWRWMRWLGLRSYSIYALHFPIVLVVLYATQHWQLTGWNAIALTVGIGGPVSLLAAAISFHYVEGPSLKRVDAVGRRPALT